MLFQKMIQALNNAWLRLEASFNKKLAWYFTNGNKQKHYSIRYGQLN